MCLISPVTLRFVQTNNKAIIEVLYQSLLCWECNVIERFYAQKASNAEIGATRWRQNESCLATWSEKNL